jgi:Divergent InlB B-repeat domain
MGSALMWRALPIAMLVFSSIASAQTFSNLDDISTTGPSGWQTCTYTAGPPAVFCAGGTGIPTSLTQTWNNASPSLDGESMFLSLTGPTNTNTNTGWYYDTGPSSASTTLSLNFSFYPVSLTKVNALEFDQFQYVLAGSSGLTVNSRYYWGTQCVIGGDWDVWNSYTGHWIDTGAACTGITAGAWNHLVIDVHRVAGDTSGTGGYGKMYFDSITLNSTNVISGCGSTCTTSAGALPSTWSAQTGLMLQLDTSTTCASPCTISEYIDELGETLSSTSSNYTLTVTNAGGGVAADNFEEISCNPTCTSSYVSGTQVTLNAAPNPGYNFVGWSGGGCSGIGSCTVTMSAAQSVTAVFAANVSGSANLQMNGSQTSNGHVLIN